MPLSDGEVDCYDSVDEDAELELSCALHDLALRVKTFEQRMQEELVTNEDEEEVEEDIDEEIPEVEEDEIEEDMALASPKRSPPRRKGKRSHALRPKDMPSKESEGYASCDEQQQPECWDSKGSGSRRDWKQNPDDNDGDQREDWDDQEQKAELKEIKNNIALLLESMQEEARALEKGNIKAESDPLA